jgi:hypothetical protein
VKWYWREEKVSRQKHVPVTLSTINTTCADPSLNLVVCDENSANGDLDNEAVTLLQCSCESLVSRTALSDERAGLSFVRVSYMKLSNTNGCKKNLVIVLQWGLTRETEVQSSLLLKTPTVKRGNALGANIWTSLQDINFEIFMKPETFFLSGGQCPGGLSFQNKCITFDLSFSTTCAKLDSHKTESGTGHTTRNFIQTRPEFPQIKYDKLPMRKWARVFTEAY